MIRNIFKILIVSSLTLFLAQCSTYTVKKDMTKKGELTKTPKWYIKFDREDKKALQLSGNHCYFGFQT